MVQVIDDEDSAAGNYVEEAWTGLAPALTALAADDVTEAGKMPCEVKDGVDKDSIHIRLGL